MNNLADQTLSYLFDKIKAEVDPLTDHIADGGCETFEKYKYSVGKRDGLYMAQMLVEELDKKLSAE
jgi:hypothetical protein